MSGTHLEWLLLKAVLTTPVLMDSSSSALASAQGTLKQQCSRLTCCLTRRLNNHHSETVQLAHPQYTSRALEPLP